MKKKYLQFIVILIAFVLILPNSSFALKKIGQTGFKFLSNPVGARTMAMGNSYMGIAHDATAMFLNPGLLARIETMDGFFDFHKGIADINMYSGAFAVALNEGNWGVMGLSFRIMDYGTFHGTRRADSAIEGVSYVDMKDFSPTTFCLGLGYSKMVSSFFDVGCQLKVVHQSVNAGWIGKLAGEVIDPYTIKDVDPALTFIALDVGIMYYTGYKNTRFGVSVRNFSQEKRFYREEFPLPFEIRFGGATNLLEVFEGLGIRNLFPEFMGEGRELTFTSDFNHSRDYTPRVHMGLEYWMKDMFALRTGYKFNYDEENVTYGFGLKYNNFRLDYAYNPFGIFNDVQKITVGYTF